MLEPKSRDEMATAEVLAKRDAAVQWCKHARAHAQSYGGKRWRYALIPHDVIAENLTLKFLAERFGVE
jgi:type III restriction enzyme